MYLRITQLVLLAAIIGMLQLVHSAPIQEFPSHRAAISKRSPMLQTQRLENGGKPTRKVQQAPGTQSHLATKQQETESLLSKSTKEDRIKRATLLVKAELLSQGPRHKQAIDKVFEQTGEKRPLFGAEIQPVLKQMIPTLTKDELEVYEVLNHEIVVTYGLSKTEQTAFLTQLKAWHEDPTMRQRIKDADEDLSETFAEELYVQFMKSEGWGKYTYLPWPKDLWSSQPS